jgi:hypothetical protein
MLEELLAKEKGSILDRWFQLVVGTYPTETARFLTTQKNEFTNPVGSNLLKGLEGLYNGLVDGKSDASEFSEFLDQIIRIRAVQDLAPSEALVFVFFIKNAVREKLAQHIEEYKLFEELLSFESGVDRLALLAFNIYVQCRESLYDVKVAEIRRQTSRILERASQKYGTAENWLGPDDDKIAK